MVEQFSKEENLHIIKEIEMHSDVTQRSLSIKLGISLGKTNYLLRALIKKGFIEVHNFSDNNGKLKKIQYLLTKNGIEHKMYLMQLYLKEKEVEYFRIKQEWEQLVVKK